jgi:hypothetical protein
MSNPVWGVLEKALDDPQTILEAVDAKIAAHEADEEAHLGAGESLQSHRASEIIDHAAASVLADKLTSTEGVFESSFDSIDAWTKSAGVGLETWGNVGFFVDPDSGETQYLYTLAPIPVNFLNFGKDMLWQTIFQWIPAIDHVSWNIGINEAAQLAPNKGFGFYFDGHYLKAYFHDGSTCHYSTAIAGIANAQHVFRVQHIALTKTLNFYIDGALVYTYTYDVAPSTGTGYVLYYISSSDNGEAEFMASKITVSREI